MRSTLLRSGVTARYLQTSAPEVQEYANPISAALRTFEDYRAEADHQHDLPLFCLDLGVAQRQYDRWTRNLPTVRPYYAVKCNPDTNMLQQLAACGAGFDCATSAEIDAVIALGVQPENIIFAHPVKSFNDLSMARDRGVKKLTFDNADELRKVHANYPEAELVLRLLADDTGSVMRFGEKFGADLDEAARLLDLSKELGLNIIGVSFHIGSGCFDPSKYDDAIGLSRTIFDMAAEREMPPMTFLDVGGGFPGDPTPHKKNRDGVPSFESFAAIIKKSLASNFPSTSYADLEVIAEPGRYFATASGTLFTMVQGKRQVKDTSGPGGYLYYVNDGVYGSFNSVMFDYYNPKPMAMEDFKYEGSKGTKRPLRSAHAGFSTRTVDLVNSTVFGPTCDSLDKVVENYPLRELQIGEWLVFDHMGAYSTAAASTFNGVPRPVQIPVRSLAP